MHLFNYYFLSILTIILMLSCQSKQTEVKEVVTTASEAIQKDMDDELTERKTILCFGNSLTAGYGLDDESTAWPSLLQARLDSLGLDYTVVNAGLSGETTSGGLNRIDWVLSQDVDVFFLELGANDMLRGLDVKATKENLSQLLDKVKEKHADIPIIIAGMISPANMGPDYEKTFNQIFPELAEQYDAELIPFFLDGVAGEAALNLADGKHPNAEGQKIVLETVWQTIESVLESK